MVWPLADRTSTFVASLELARQGEVVLQQDGDFSPIQAGPGLAKAGGAAQNA